MKLVIDIPEEEYKCVQITGHIGNAAQISNAIFTGKPLPKGHGRLVDADEAIETLKSIGNRDYRREKGTIQEAEKMLSFDEYTPTVIEADAESEVEK